MNADSYSGMSLLQVVEAADLAQYLADVAQTGLEYLDGRYVDTANKSREANQSLPAVPNPTNRSLSSHFAVILQSFAKATCSYSTEYVSFSCRSFCLHWMKRLMGRGRYRHHT